ncbi:MAG TPA: hypothetical protein VIA18_30255 [Polyangia bacterium]|nr:hypothetical protein [Polyangia bacterium]
MTEAERDALVEQVAGAFRTRDPRDGRAQPHPAWRDLDDAGRAAAFDRAAASRTLEAALDPDGLSTTARAVLARIRR